MSGWRFAGNDLLVVRTPAPVRTAGYRKIAFEAPGVDGITASLDNGRMPTLVTVTILARSAEELETLSALFESGFDGDLKMPHGDDAWVYEDAYVQNGAQWRKTAGNLWEGRVDFICPDPRPRWLSTGERVY